MSLLSSFAKKSKLTATIKQTQQARKSEGNTADQLFKSAYLGYAEVLLDDPIRADALYNWGFALLHQAKTKEGEVAAAIYRDAINKFTFCLLINPDYLGSAINGGVAYMDLARLQAVPPEDTLYSLAQQQFENANRIQAGTASYNLACIYALRGDFDNCLKALENSQSRGSLPDIEDILNDPDLDKVKEQDWFIAFIEPLMKTETEEAQTDSAVETSESPTQTTTAIETNEVSGTTEAKLETDQPTSN